MKSWTHAAIGAAVAVAPDAVLFVFGWWSRWLPADHPLVRAHRFLHSRNAVPLVVGLAWASHLVADRLSGHRGERWQ